MVRVAAWSASFPLNFYSNQVTICQLTQSCEMIFAYKFFTILLPVFIPFVSAPLEHLKLLLSGRGFVIILLFFFLVPKGDLQPGAAAGVRKKPSTTDGR